MANEDKTHNKIIHLLKTRGPLTANILAKELGVTTMGVRQHMLKLESRSIVVYEDKKARRGRPTRYWSLTKESNSYFPNGHEFLTVKIIESVKTVFGKKGLDQLIKQRENESFVTYSKTLDKYNSLEDKLLALADIRTDEGYMASIKIADGNYWLIENHCSICAAASSCLNFCQSELQLFQSLLRGTAHISREEHILSGARRCAYKIIPLDEKNSET